MKDKAHDAFLAALRGLEGTQLPLAKDELEFPQPPDRTKANSSKDRVPKKGESK